MASAVPFMHSIVLLGFFLALFRGGGARELAPEGGLSRQVESQNRQDSKLTNLTRVTSKPVLPGATDIHPNYADGNEILQVFSCPGYAIIPYLKYAVIKSEISEYFGVKATFSVHALPDVGPNQSCSVGMWLAYILPGDTGDNSNAIRVGWNVRPDLYGDTQTHLLEAWTLDNFGSTGCYNLDCPGFVLLDSSPVTPGQILSSVATDGGEQTYITLSVNLESGGDWWLGFGDGHEVTSLVGYWPGSLFPELSKEALFVEIGALVDYPKGTEGPPMGSGHHAWEGANKAASVKNIQLMDESTSYQLVKPGTFHGSVSSKDCYDLVEGNDPLSGEFGFYYGGPQGCTSE